MKQGRRLLLAMVVGFSLGPVARGGEVREVREVREEVRKDFEWFGRLGYPNLKKVPWVEVTRAVEGGHRAVVAHGFLLEASAEGFTVLPLDLAPRKLTLTMPGPRGLESLAWEEKTFAAAAKEYLAGMREGETDSAWSFRGQWGLRLGLKSQAFVMAYACWEKDQATEALAIYDAATRIQPWNIGEPVAKTQAGMQAALEQELAHAATWRAVLEFGAPEWMVPPDPSKLRPRTELLVMFRELERRYPHNPHGAMVKATISVLEQMVAEDAKHRVLSREEISKLPVEEQVREWIFQLRDQNGQQFSQPGWCDIFGDMHGLSGGGQSPAHELVKIGYPAVPQLIKALDDERLSRSVGFGRDFVFSHHVLTVAECSQQILNRIAKRTFSSWVGGCQPEARPKYLAAYRKEVKAWWEDFQAKGEAGCFIDGVSGGLADPRGGIKRLKEIQPEAVEAAVIAGAKNSRGNLLYLEELGALKTPAARECLVGFKKTGDALRVRTEAARQLWLQDDPSAIPAMIAEWKALPPDGKRDPDWGRNALIQILAVSGEPPALRALAEGWSGRNVEQRFDVIAMLGNVLATEQNPRPSWGKEARIDPAAVKVAEALFGEALADTAVYEGRSGSHGDFNFSNPRVCDFALFGLSKTFPKDYKFSEKADDTQWETERQEALETWKRKSAGSPG